MIFITNDFQLMKDPVVNFIKLAPFGLAIVCTSEKSVVVKLGLDVSQGTLVRIHIIVANLPRMASQGRRFLGVHLRRVDA
jgi:hypothetical protein